jgi:hypothetical protein
MLNVFRRHRSGCSLYGKRTEKCPRKPPCPIHVEGVDGRGVHHRPKALIDPVTQSGVRDWSRASEIVRDMEAPAPLLVAEKRTTIEAAIKTFLEIKETKSIDVFRKNRNLLERLRNFMQAAPRSHAFVSDIPATIHCHAS